MLVAVSGVLLLGGGCATLGWYAQAVRGQVELLTNREDIEKLIASPETPPAMRRKLELVLEAREFARAELALPDNDSYTRYVHLDRDAVVYNVVAAPEFGLEPKTWCYPFVGCLAYRGYFRREAAERRAAKLAERGYDTRVSPVPAYSTLGRFEDPVTTPMLAMDETRLVGLLFHELAHQRVFVPGETEFNEAYATTVERKGLVRWLEQRGECQRLDRWREARRVERAFTEMLLEFRTELKRLYARSMPPDTMRRRKREKFAELAERYRDFRERHDTDRFDGFMNRGPNNADLALLATYEAGTGAFADLLAEYGGNFERFHRAVERLAAAEPDARADFLNRCRNRVCP